MHLIKICKSIELLFGPHFELNGTIQILVAHLFTNWSDNSLPSWEADIWTFRFKSKMERTKVENILQHYIVIKTQVLNGAVLF